MKELREYLESTEQPDKAILMPILTRLEEKEKRRKKIMKVIQETMEQCKLDIKYLLFDLHCTKKERDEALKT